MLVSGMHEQLEEEWDEGEDDDLRKAPEQQMVSSTYDMPDVVFLKAFEEMR